jgi:hypothetical protein
MIQKGKLDSEESMRKQIEIMNAFGSRATGSNDHQEFIHVKSGDYSKAKGKIAVVEIKILKKLPIGLIMNKRAAYPGGTRIAAGDGDLVLTSVLRNPDLKKAKARQ